MTNGYKENTILTKEVKMDKTENKTIARSMRFYPHVWETAVWKAKALGMKVPAYISQLIIKDNGGG